MTLGSDIARTNVNMASLRSSDTLIQALSLPSKGESSRCSVPYSLSFWVRAANFTCARSSVFSFRVSFTFTGRFSLYAISAA